MQERVEERPREPLLEADHRRLQLPAGDSSPPSSGTTAELGAPVPEVVGDGAAGGEPLRPSFPRPGRGRRGDDDAAAGAPAARAGGGERGGEGGGGRRRRREHRRRGLGFAGASREGREGAEAAVETGRGGESERSLDGGGSGSGLPGKMGWGGSGH